MERLTIKAPSGLIHLKDNTEMTMNVAIKKLSDFEDLEEQNRLLKLPCAVGDTVYVLEKSQTGRVMIYQTTADSFYCAIWALDGKFGKYIFPTYAEAEAALKELERVRTAQALM